MMWISVKDRLPENENVLAMEIVHEKYRFIVSCRFIQGKFISDETGDKIEANYWMTLPEPPEEKMDRLKKSKAFLEKLNLTDSDYQDNGMIDHIADLIERYHTEQLHPCGDGGFLSDSANKLSNLKLKLDKLSDDERSKLINEYCLYCGSKDSACQCWNDD